MTRLFLRLFVKNYQEKENPGVRARVGKLSGLVGIFCNVLLCVGKLMVGAISGSVSITADAMNNLSDAASSVVTLIGFKLAERPADEDHPYGHARYEYLSGLAVAALILIIGFELGKTSVEKILHPAAVAFSAPLVIVLVGSILVKLWMFVFNRYLGRHISSGALLATAADSRNDVISTGAVLIAAIFEGFTGYKVDGFMGLAVAFFILYSGVQMAKETISPLLGESASPELQKSIVSAISQEESVLGYHDLMVHDYGPGQRFASMHVEMDQEQDALVCHELIDSLERKCLREMGVHLVIHYDPVVVGDEKLDEMRQFLQQSLFEYHERLSLHDFRMVQGKKHINLIFDIALPQELRGQEKAIKAHMQNALAQKDQSEYHLVVTFDPEAFNQH
ncbi:MAG: cation transporter [Oscillospiraceae bacterium]|nr:cation transporter [Oscillospiraceae bacterium]